MASDEERGGSGRPERPEYTVYRSRPSLLDRFRKREPRPLKKERKPERERSRREPDRKQGRDRDDPSERRDYKSKRARPPWLRILKWAAVAALAWLAVSFLAFAVSAQLQKGKLADDVDVGALPLMPVVPQTILVLGTDIRSGQFAGAAEAETKGCIEAIGGGLGSHASCRHAPYRSDTIMLIRAGGGDFRQLSLPRDTLADIPGLGINRVNAAYANGGASLVIETVESYFGLEIDQVAIVDFDGFRAFIDTLGGVNVNLPMPVCSNVSAGAFALDLSRGEHTLNGYQAITLARTRTAGDCDEDGLPDQPITDLDRARFQQLILDGIQDRLTSPTRLPFNFVKGPWLGWNAPRAIVSSMGALTMPELAIAAAIGSSQSIQMEPTSLDPVIFPQEECERAARRFLGKRPSETPACSPATG